MRMKADKESMKNGAAEDNFERGSICRERQKQFPTESSKVF